jgi:CubicO group peptidase (beta-lactamase class C family)
MIATDFSFVSRGNEGLPERPTGIRPWAYFFARNELPGAVVLIVQRDKVVFRKAFGHRAKVPEHTLMTEDGKLGVNDPIARHRPAFARKETENITIAHLLTHTGGFIADNPIADYSQGKEKAWERLFALTPSAAPDSKFTYSDVSYTLLRKIVEKAGAMPLDQFAAKRIYGPLGMNETGYRPEGM